MAVAINNHDIAMSDLYISHSCDESYGKCFADLCNNNNNNNSLPTVAAMSISKLLYHMNLNRYIYRYRRMVGCGRRRGGRGYTYMLDAVRSHNVVFEQDYKFLPLCLLVYVLVGWSCLYTLRVTA